MHAEVLQARGQLDTRGEVELLVRSLDDESLAVRATALQALCNLLSQRRDWTMKLLTAEGGDSGSIAESSESSLVSRLISALLRCCEPEAGNVASFQAQRVCAECLGLLGAVDPSRVKVDLQPLAAMCRQASVWLGVEGCGVWELSCQPLTVGAGCGCWPGLAVLLHVATAATVECQLPSCPSV